MFFNEQHFKAHIIGKQYCSLCKNVLLDQRENKSCVVG